MLTACTVMYAQDVATPLTIQGLDQFSYTSARSRAMGGSGVALGSDVSAMFANPATLLQLSTPEVRVGGYRTSTKYQQMQQWVPNRFYGGLSLMFEDLLDGIKGPQDTSGRFFGGDTAIQRPYDDLGPNWSKNTSDIRPSLAALGMPFTIGEIRFAAALGFSEIADLNSYFQNNNMLDPNIGLYRPAPIPIVLVGDSLKANWFQYVRQREGTINGVTPAMSVELKSGWSVGISATILFGSSDDFEQRVERGRLTFFYDKFRSDLANYRMTKTGTSKYKGVLPTIGGMLEEDAFSLGVSIRLPMTITRDWDRTVLIDTTGRSQSFTETGSDKIAMPAQVTIGGALHPTKRLDVSFDYEIRNFADVRYTPQAGSTTNPWLSNRSVRAGLEYRPDTWLALRGGYRQIASSFSPAGAALVNEPLSGVAYTAGVGMKFDMISVDLAYEFAHVRYEDAWQSNVNYNQTDTHTIWLETGVKF